MQVPAIGGQSIVGAVADRDDHIGGLDDVGRCICEQQPFDDNQPTRVGQGGVDLRNASEDSSIIIT